MGIAYDETRHQLKVLNADGKFDGITRGLGANELLVDVRLVLHVLPEEKDFDIVYDGLKNPVIYPALGRYEDLLRIDDVREVEIVPTERPNAFFDAYVPEYMHASIGKCSRYSLNKVYSYSDEKKKTREWEKVSAYHVSKNTNIMRCAGAFEEKVSKTGVFFA
jgi:CRISPR-associated protein Cas5t